MKYLFDSLLIINSLLVAFRGSSFQSLVIGLYR